jgi:predicted branched-subunit amino acid permease
MTMTLPAGLASVSGMQPFWRGFLAMLPLWSGAIPIGIAYAVAARGIGLGPGETQLMSAMVFSAAAQVSVTSLLASGAALPLLVATVLALNAQLLLIGIAVGRAIELSWPKRLLLACVLTDGAYGVTVARGPLILATLLGAGVAMFVGWNLGTLLGILAGQALPDPRGLGLDFVVPLAFLAVLVPLLRTRTAALVAALAGVVTLMSTRVLPVGPSVLLAGGVGCAVGAWLTRAES